MKTVHVFFLALLALVSQSRAQLAITEALSSASTNKGPNQVTQNSDFWELTNFGSTPIDLTGYRFFDSANNLAAADPTVFEGLTIGAGESVLLVQSNVNTNAAQVREWWGLPETVQVRLYATPGFSSTGDGIRLWGPTATDAADVVDSVDFADALRGSTFTYNPETGVFGAYSTNGVGGAFQAMTADDIGSPGKNTGPTQLRISQQPTNVVVNAGDTARLTVQSLGLPRARVQWFFGDAAIDGATKATLEVVDVQAEKAGQYHARLENGVTNLNSATVEIVLQSQASAPAFTLLPTNLTLTIGQGRVFQSQATGVPQPTYQWQFEGADIDGATAQSFPFTATGVEQTGDYSVIARNALGSATNHFQITVTTPPRLVITEVMSSENANTPAHTDFWELTNFGDFPVSLLGYRFDDNSESLAVAFTFTNDVVIAPGESIIFTETITAEAFRTWWGADKLPAGLKIFTYTGNGLSSGGDAVNVWNAAATENFDKVASAVFSTATIGVSFRYNPDTEQFGELSTVDTFGAFAAAVGGDIGSPGFVTAPAAKPSITEIKRVDATLSITWTSVAGKQYVLEGKDDLAAATWTTIRTTTAAGATTTETVPMDAGAAQRFFRVSAQ